MVWTWTRKGRGPSGRGLGLRGSLGTSEGRCPGDGGKGVVRVGVCDAVKGVGGMCLGLWSRWVRLHSHAYMSHIRSPRRRFRSQW